MGASTKEEKFRRIPSLGGLEVTGDAAYVRITSSNTVYGSRWQGFPDTKWVPLVADMSSDNHSKPFDVSRFGLIYAGAQKHLGPSGVTDVIIRRDLLGRSRQELPTMLNYTTHATSRSLYNRPPTFGSYLLGKVLSWG